MRKVKCTLPEGGTIEVRAETFNRVIQGGDVIDLDRVVVPAQEPSKDGQTPGRTAKTLADALGHHVAEAFEPFDPEPDAVPVAVSDDEE